jgi:hypothetical protein
MSSRLVGNSSEKLKIMKAIIHQIGVLLSTTLWMLRDNPVNSDLTKKRAHQVIKERANPLRSDTRNPHLKMSNAFGVALSYLFDTNSAVTTLVDQKQMPAAVHAAAIRSFFTDSSIRELTYILGSNDAGPPAAGIRSQDRFIRPAIQRMKRRRTI